MPNVIITVEVEGQSPGVPGKSRLFPYNVIEPNPPRVTLKLNDTTGITSYFWEFLDKPKGSTALFDDPTAAQPHFTPDAGVTSTYLMRCTVNDGQSSGKIALAFGTQRLDVRKLAAGEGPEFDDKKGWVAAYNDFIDKIEAKVGLAGQGKVDDDDTDFGYLSDKLAAGTGIYFSILETGGGSKTLRISAVGTSFTDELVKFTSLDSTPGYLMDKINVLGDSVTKLVVMPGENQSVTYHVGGDFYVRAVGPNGNTILQAIAEASQLTPNGLALSKTNRAKVFLGPGVYTMPYSTAPYQIPAAWNYVDVVGYGEHYLNSPAYFDQADFSAYWFSKLINPQTVIEFSMPTLFLFPSSGAMDFSFKGIKFVQKLESGTSFDVESGSAIEALNGHPEARLIIDTCVFSMQRTRADIDSMTYHLESRIVSITLSSTAPNNTWKDVTSILMQGTSLNGVDNMILPVYSYDSSTNTLNIQIEDLASQPPFTGTAIIYGYLPAISTRYGQLNILNSYIDGGIIFEEFLSHSTIDSCYFSGGFASKKHLMSTIIKDSKFLGTGPLMSYDSTVIAMDAYSAILNSTFNGSSFIGPVIVDGIIKDCTFNLDSFIGGTAGHTIKLINCTIKVIAKSLVGYTLGDNSVVADVSIMSSNLRTVFVVSGNNISFTKLRAISQKTDNPYISSITNDTGSDVAVSLIDCLLHTDIDPTIQNTVPNSGSTIILEKPIGS